MKTAQLIITYILFLCCIIFSENVYSQNAIKLKVQLRTLDYLPVRQKLDLRIENNKAVWQNDEGKFEFLIPDSKQTVAVMLNESNQKVFYPVNGVLFVPRDISTTIDIIIGTNKDYATLLSVWPLIKKMETLQKTNADLCEVAKQFTKEVNDLKPDSVIEKRKRDSTFQAISVVFNTYINRAMNLKTTLVGFDSVYFNNVNAVNYLNEKLNAYSDSWEVFQQNKDVYNNLVSQYWNSGSKIVFEFNNLIDEIEETHEIYFLSFNTTINEFRKATVIRNEKEKTKQLKIVFQEFDSKMNDVIFNEKLRKLDEEIKRTMELLNQ